MAYIGKTPSQAVRSRYFYTASGGETSFSGADDNGNSLVYTDGNYVDVYLNGVLLVAGADYNTNTTNTVAGITAVAASDIVEIVVYDTFSVFGGDVLGDFTISNGNFTANSLIYPTADGTSGQFMTTDGSGNLSFATVNTNLVADLTPQLGGTLDANGNSIDMGTYTITDAKVGQWDTAYGWGDHSTQNYAVTTGDTMTGDLTFGDGVKAVFGSTTDGIQIYNEASGDKRIVETGSGNLKLQADNIYLQNTAGTANHLIGITGAAVTLNYNNNPKIATTSGGVDVTGSMTADGAIIQNSSAAGTQIVIENTSATTSTNYKIVGGKVGVSNEGFSIYDSANATTAYYIHSSGNHEFLGGNVGIGTSPSVEFEIASSAPQMRITDTDTNAVFQINASSTTGGVEIQADATDVGSNPFMAFDVGGSEKVRILDSGNVGINTTSASADFEVYRGSSNVDIKANRGDADYIQLSAGSTRNFITSNTYPFAIDVNGSERMRIDASGNVGIGTSPDSGTPLHVAESSASLGANPTASAFLVERAGNVGMTLGTANTGLCSVFMGDTDSLTTGRVQYDNSDDSLQFWANSIERMRIDSSGNVGISETNPINKLHIRNTTHSSTITGNATAGSIKFHSQSGSYTNGDYYGGIVWARPNSNGGTPTTFIASKITNSGSAADLVFGADTATTITERMRIDNAGRVTMPYQPCCFAYNSGNGNSTSASGSGVLNTSGTNVGNHFSSSTGRFTCPVAGNYLVTWHAMNGQGNTGTVTATLRVNGVGYSYFHIENSHPQSCSQQVVYSASAGDYFDLSISHFHFNGGSTYKYPGMSVVLIG